MTDRDPATCDAVFDARCFCFEPMTNRELLELAIERSGLSARAFAREVMWRDERTVRRWLSGESPVPSVVADRLREELSKR